MHRPCLPGRLNLFLFTITCKGQGRKEESRSYDGDRRIIDYIDDSRTRSICRIQTQIRWMMTSIPELTQGTRSRYKIKGVDIIPRWFHGCLTSNDTPDLLSNHIIYHYKGTPLRKDHEDPLDYIKRLSIFLSQFFILFTDHRGLPIIKGYL